MPTSLKTVLITVKAYPNPSTKYKETVCCAGIDLSTNEWIRLYPIPFRYLDKEKQFDKYSIIEARCTKAADKRPESFKVDSDSIQIVGHLDTRDHWKKRRDIILPTLAGSFCEILEHSKTTNKSLGAFRPTAVDFFHKNTPTKKDKGNEDIFFQLSFFDGTRGVLERIPYSFYYTFKCEGKPNCDGHTLLIIDWEIGEAYRKWKNRYKSENELIEKIKEKWLSTMCAPDKDIIFFVGNQRRFNQNFMVLGTFYPPKQLQTELLLA